MSVSREITIKKAVLFNAIAKYSTVILQLVYTAIMSRILSPEEYGIMTIINVFIVFFQLFSDMGLGTGVIQNKNLSNDDISDIFSVSVYLGCGLFVAFSLFSYPIALIYENGIYVSLGVIMSFSLMFNAFNMIPNAVLLREKRFLALAIRTIVISFISFTVTIFFAFHGAGVYSLVIQSVVQAIGLFACNIFSTKIRFKIKPNLSPIKGIWGYSMYQFGAQTLNYFNRNLDNLLIGKMFSKEELGYYNKAYTLMQYPIGYLPGVITPVLHPILSEHQENKAYIYEKYMQVLKLLSLIGCFGAALCFFAGEEIIIIVFGKQWEASILPFKILSLSLWFQILTNTIAPIYQSIGNTKLMFKNLIFTTIIIVSLIITGVLSKNIIYVSVCVAIGYITNFFVTFFLLVKIGFCSSYMRFLRSFWQELVMFIIMLIGIVLWDITIPSLILSFVLKMSVLSVIYFILLLVTKQYKLIWAFVKRK